MNLTKNEKKVLKLLLEQARITDSDIADRLGISSQAVGKIRRKLEENIIDGYTVNLNHSKLGLETQAIAIARITREGQDRGELEIEQALQKIPHITQVYRLPKGSSTHVLIYTFSDLNELDSFFHSQRVKDEMHKYLEIQELFTFSHHSMIKNSCLQLLHKAIDSAGHGRSEVRFRELESFKRRL